MTKILLKIRSRLFAGLATQDDLDRLYSQIAGLAQIQNAMCGNPVLRPMRGWAISPDAIAWVLINLQGRVEPTVIEFGSGQSTIILATALRNSGGKLLSVEHDPEYSATIRAQAEACGVVDHIEFVHSSLADAQVATRDRSYDLSCLSQRMIDVALIDGPPVRNGKLTRLTPLVWAAKHLTPRGTIFLDDAARDEEQACVKQFLKEFPNFMATERIAEKGLIELRMN